MPNWQNFAEFGHTAPVLLSYDIEAAYVKGIVVLVQSGLQRIQVYQVRNRVRVNRLTIANLVTKKLLILVSVPKLGVYLKTT